MTLEPVDGRGEILLHNLLAFLRGLHNLGFLVGVDEAKMVLLALTKVGVEEEEVCRFAVQTVVVKHVEELPVFQVAWQEFWQSLTRGPHPWLANNTLWANVLQRFTERHRHPQVIWLGSSQGVSSREHESTSDLTEVHLQTGASARNTLQQKDFAELTDLERQELLRAHLPKSMPRYRAHRWIKAKHGKMVDLGTTVRQGVQFGEWIQLTSRRRRWKPRPVVVLCDVSGSMDPYSRMVLRFVHLLTRSHGGVETFTFGTNLHRVTNVFKYRDPDFALTQLSREIPDYSGGTRIAECLNQFNRNWSSRVIHHKAIVILATDGLDSGNEEDLKRELIRLSRNASRVVWWNPNLRDPGFQPIARGTSVLYDTVDEMWPASSWVHLEQFWNHYRDTRK